MVNAHFFQFDNQLQIINTFSQKNLHYFKVKTSKIRKCYSTPQNHSEPISLNFTFKVLVEL